MAEEYLDRHRMMSYYNQLRIIQSLGKQVNEVLEIGIFNSLMSALLPRNGYHVTTADIDPELKPDLVLNLQTDFDLPQNKFDAIVAFQVLEHIPYEYFEKTLKKFSESTKKYIVISLPYRSIFWTLQFHSYFSWRSRYLMLQIPQFWSSKPWSDEHYWEIGLKGYPKKRIVESFKNAGLKMKRQYQDPYNPYHYFFVLEK